MESQEKATQILEKQIAEVQDVVLEIKIQIADLFISVNKKPLQPNTSVDIFLEKIGEIAKMPSLLEAFEKNQAKLEALFKSKSAIENCYLT